MWCVAWTRLEIDLNLCGKMVSALKHLLGKMSRAKASRRREDGPAHSEISPIINRLIHLLGYDEERTFLITTQLFTSSP
jgi:hypothetical protein